jgi:hypothetical protein
LKTKVKIENNAMRWYHFSSSNLEGDEMKIILAFTVITLITLILALPSKAETQRIKSYPQISLKTDRSLLSTQIKPCISRAFLIDSAVRF